MENSNTTNPSVNIINSGLNTTPVAPEVKSEEPKFFSSLGSTSSVVDTKSDPVLSASNLGVGQDRQNVDNLIKETEYNKSRLISAFFIAYYIYLSYF